MKLSLGSWGWLIALSLLMFTGCERAPGDNLPDQTVQNPEQQPEVAEEEDEEAAEEADPRRADDEVVGLQPANPIAAEPAVIIQNFQHAPGL